MDKTIIFDTISAQKSTTSQQDKVPIIASYFIKIYQNNFFNSQKFKSKQKRKIIFHIFLLNFKN